MDIYGPFFWGNPTVWWALPRLEGRAERLVLLQSGDGGHQKDRTVIGKLQAQNIRKLHIFWIFLGVTIYIYICIFMYSIIFVQLTYHFFGTVPYLYLVQFFSPSCLVIYCHFFLRDSFSLSPLIYQTHCWFVLHIHTYVHIHIYIYMCTYIDNHWILGCASQIVDGLDIYHSYHMYMYIL